jgi:ribonuclease VapC
MVVETSAIVAVILEEAGFEELVFKVAEADARFISVASYVEASMVLVGRRGECVVRDLDRVLAEMEIAVIPMTVTEARIAQTAFLKYGKGRHPARLNLGDCFSYALAKYRNEPLLFKGNDFSRTDVLVA